MPRVVYAIAVFLAAAAANAAPVVETEVGGTATNNTIGTAQLVPGAAFTMPGPPTVFNPAWNTATVSGKSGEFDVDFYRFATGAGRAHLDLDNTPFTFDSILSLFNVSGTLIAFDDDSFNPDLGSESGLDSFIGEITLAAGTYYAVVTRFSNFATSTFAPGVVRTDLTRPDGFFGGSRLSNTPIGDSTFNSSGSDSGLAYTLHISLENAAAVPEPETFALLLAGLGLLGFASRRRFINRK